MKFVFTLSLFACFMLQIASAQFQFIAPMPGSTNLPAEHNIIIREGHLLDPSSLDKKLFIIRGSKSGAHDFEMILCDDGKTLNLNPTTPFAYDEAVAVTISKGLVTTEGKTVDGYSFSFTTHCEWTAAEQANMKNMEQQMLDNEIKKWGIPSTEASGEDDTRGISGMFTIGVNTSPTAGDVFFDSWSGNFVSNKFTGYNVITNNGDSVYWKKLSAGPNDLQMGKNGNFDTYRSDLGIFNELDSNFIAVDNWTAVNGYGTNNHELTMLADGSVWLIANEYQTVDMTVYNPTYSPNATVLGNNIQHLDASHHILFEWRGFDHVTYNEAQHENLAYSFIDYMHTNSIDVDGDGNIIVSHRHLEQVTKINVSNGSFIWRLGGLNNDFTFPNDPAKISYQHDARRIGNGNLTLFDDGNFHSPAKSFAKEYQLDEVNKVATLAWSYSLPDINGSPAFYFAMGSVQRLSNGNTFIDWGWRSQSSAPSFTEVTSAGTKVWELSLTDGGKNIVSYRAHKYPWTPCARVTYSKLTTKNITASSANLKWDAVANKTQQYLVEYKKDIDATWIDKKVSPTTYNLVISGLAASTKYDWRIKSRCDTVANISSNYTDIKKFTTHAQRSQLLDEVTEITLRLYPNPASDVVIISNYAAISQVRVMNLVGQEVKKIVLGEGSADQMIQLSLGNLAAGNYFVEVLSGGKMQVRKLVVE